MCFYARAIVRNVAIHHELAVCNRYHVEHFSRKSSRNRLDDTVSFIVCHRLWAEIRRVKFQHWRTKGFIFKKFFWNYLQSKARNCVRSVRERGCVSCKNRSKNKITGIRYNKFPPFLSWGCIAISIASHAERVSHRASEIEWTRYQKLVWILSL